MVKGLSRGGIGHGRVSVVSMIRLIKPFLFDDFRPLSCTLAAMRYKQILFHLLQYEI